MFDLSGILGSLTTLLQDCFSGSLVTWITDLISSWLPVA
jgi:hypothetical protein